MDDLNRHIKKSHLKMVEKFNAELEAFRKETQEDAATLYENANTSFTLSNVRVEDGVMRFVYDGKKDSHTVVMKDHETGEYYEDDTDGIVEWIGFWRKCLKRARRYWSMDAEKLDAIQEGETEDIEDE